MEIEDAAVHGTTTALGGIEAGTEPFEIGSVAAVDGDVEQTCGRELKGVLGLALDGLGQFFGGDLAQREINGGQMLAIEGVEFGVVGGAVLGAEPPAPVATLGGEQRFVRYLKRGFGGGVRPSLLLCFDGAGIGIARVP